MKFVPDELLKILVASRSLINFMDEHIDPTMHPTMPVLPQQPKDVVKKLEDWIVFIDEGIETRKELKDREISEEDFSEREE
jgi:hypothetical protein